MNFNFDVNAFVEQIAQGLGVAKDVVIQLYPHIIQEYSWYKIGGVITTIGVLVGIITGVLTLLHYVITHTSSELMTDDEIQQASEIFSNGVKIAVLGWIAYILGYGLQVFMAPNINLFIDLMTM